MYSVQKLLAEKTDEFDKGSFITIYLAPHNYHRVHVPLTAKLNQVCYLPGELFSVNSTTAEQLPNLYARNERLICWFTTDEGSMAQILVGAMLVAGIKPVWLTSAYEPRMQVVKNIRQEFRQGDELGQFQMGSTVILLFSEPLDFIVEEGSKIQVGQPITS
jgi:phosphatidylserine decarboxylase